MQLIESGDNVKWEAHYHKDFPSKARALGGKWDNRRHWVFDKRDKDRVLALVKEVYGYMQDTVDIRYTVTANRRDHATKELWAFGRLVLSRPGRDNAVRLGDDVIIIDGTFPSSGGSVKYPSITGNMTQPVVLEIRNVPVNLIDPDDDLVEVLGEPETKSPLATFEDQKMTKEEILKLIDVIEEQQRLISLLLDTCEASQEMTEASERIALKTQNLRRNMILSFGSDHENE